MTADVYDLPQGHKDFRDTIRQIVDVADGRRHIDHRSHRGLAAPVVG